LQRFLQFQFVIDYIQSSLVNLKKAFKVLQLSHYLCLKFANLNNWQLTWLDPEPERAEK
jgi:hypothetical protein